MLVLGRHVNQRILIGDDITILVTAIDHHLVKLGIEAPPHLRVDREEVRLRVECERRRDGRNGP